MKFALTVLGSVWERGDDRIIWKYTSESFKLQAVVNFISVNHSLAADEPIVRYSGHPSANFPRKLSNGQSDSRCSDEGYLTLSSF
jgi:hypothetical protein